MNIKLPNISIIIVGYRSHRVLFNCIESILKQENCGWELIYIENCLEDSAIPMIQERYPFVICQDAGGNIGFGRGCNLGAQNASAKYLFFLNPDTVLRTTDTLKNMLNYMQSHTGVGLAVPLFSSLVDDTKFGIPGKNISKNYSGYKEIGNKFEFLPGEIAWACGAAMMMPREIFKKIGGFDKDYFLYSEEVDLCLRIRKEGYTIQQISNTNVMHIGSHNTRSLGKEGLIYQMLLSDYMFTRKHYTKKEHQLIWKKRRMRYTFHLITNLFLNWSKSYRYFIQLRSITLAMKS